MVKITPYPMVDEVARNITHTREYIYICLFVCSCLSAKIRVNVVHEVFRVFEHVYSMTN